MVNIGELKHKIKIYYTDNSDQNEFGEVEPKDKLFSSRKAKKWNLNKTESDALGVIVFQNKIEFTFRYLKGLEPSMFIIYEDEKYDIISLSVFGMKRWTKIVVEKHGR